MQYIVAPPANAAPTFSLANQNNVLIATWRQIAPNTSSTERNSADFLIVAVVNEGQQSSVQLSQYLTQTVAPGQHKNPAEKMQASKDLLKVLTTISKQHPQDAQYIVEMFGVKSKYKEVIKEPNNLKAMHTRLKEILRAYGAESTLIAQALGKL